MEELKKKIDNLEKVVFACFIGVVLIFGVVGIINSVDNVKMKIVLKEKGVLPQDF